MIEEGLHWSIRRSFANYVAGLADGRLVVNDGVKPSASDGLFFPLEVARVSKSLLSFRGVACFHGHFGMLAVRIAQPTLALDADHAGGVLRVAGSDGSVDFATFTLEREENVEGVSLIGRNLRLTASAAAMFGGVYALDDPLDDFVVVMSQRGEMTDMSGVVRKESDSEIILRHPRAQRNCANAAISQNSSCGDRDHGTQHG